MTKTIFLLLLVILSLNALPSQFDKRTIGANSLYTDYKVRLEGVCLGQTWAQQIAQTMSNMESVVQTQRFNLSGQQVLECTESIINKCQQANLDMIHSAIDLIKNTGITEEDCYPNQILELPQDTCRFKCADGSGFTRVVKANVEKVSLSDRESMLKRLADDGTVILGVFMIDDQMNYVYPGSFDASRKNSETPQVYGVGVGQIVGWKNKGLTLNIRMGLGSEWNYAGYAYINVEEHPEIMLEYYVLTSKFQS